MNALVHVLVISETLADNTRIQNSFQCVKELENDIHCAKKVTQNTSNTHQGITGYHKTLVWYRAAKYQRCKWAIFSGQIKHQMKTVTEQ